MTRALIDMQARRAELDEAIAALERKIREVDEAEGLPEMEWEDGFGWRITRPRRPPMAG